MGSKSSTGSRLRTVVRWGLASVAAAAGAGIAGGCLDRPLCDTDCRPKTTNVFVASVQQTSVDKIDLLFMIDNSISMADKQKVLAAAVPDLVRRLVNPVCVFDDGVTPPAEVAPGADCPQGSAREFNAVNDIHIGVVSSSLGSSGSAVCANTAMNDTKDDHGHLVATLPRAAGLNIPSGFLQWSAGTDLASFGQQFGNYVTATGESGCGYEASLEAWFRFLVDPNPYLSITTGPCSADNPNLCATPGGTDEPLLAQRNAFLRPDSLVAIIMLTDENDCSIRPDGQNYYVAEDGGQRMWRSSSTCATNPNDRCCYSCGLRPPDGCADDPVCAEPFLDRTNDDPNLRCFEQKRRFGVDFLFPVQRYVNALKQSVICMDPGRPDLGTEGCPEQFLQPNPLLVRNGVQRPSSLVFLAGIVGVPWQDIQTDVDSEGRPVPAGTLRFKTAKQMRDTLTWDIILGQPDASPPVRPQDALMIESILPRVPGNSPVLNVPLAPPNSPARANPINGHEYENQRLSDLQYACIFELPDELKVDCGAQGAPQSCDCKSNDMDGPPFDDLETEKDPLCQHPVDSTYGTTQHWAKAYPGLRHLHVLRDFGDNSIVASICARNLVDPNASDYGYRPAITAIVDRLKEALSGPCLPREVAVDEQGNYACSVVEAIPGPGIDCTQVPGRTRPDPLLVDPSFDALRSEGKCGGAGLPNCDTGAWTLCEINRAGDPGLWRAHQTECELNPGDVLNETGWCYIDPAGNIGSEEIVARCGPNEKRIIRFVGPDTPARGATALIACLGASATPSGGAPAAPPMDTSPMPPAPGPDAGP